MARKRKAPPKDSSQDGERRSKRRQTAAVAQFSNEHSGYEHASGISPISSPVAAYLPMHKRHEAQIEVRGNVPVGDVTKLTQFLENVASDEDFLSSNCITEIANTLDRARHSLDCNASERGIREDVVEQGEILFTALKTKSAATLSEMLSGLAQNVKPNSSVTRSSPLFGYFLSQGNLQDLRGYAEEYGLEEEWECASANLKQMCAELHYPSKPKRAFRAHSNTLRSASRTMKQSVQASAPRQASELVEEPLCPVKLLTGPRTVEKANKICDHLITYYQQRIVDASRTGPSHIFRDLRMIKLCLTQVFSDCVELKHTPESLFGKDKFLAYRAWRLRFESVWAAPAIGTLQKRYKDLIAINNQPLGRVELICFEFAQDLESLAIERDSPESASQQDWDYLAPRFVSLARAKKAADDFEKEYLAFQDHAYARCELTRLWLLVWRTLKAMKLPLQMPEEATLNEQSSRRSKLDSFAIERHFFESDGHPSPNSTSLQKFLQKGDASNQQGIEEYVSKYCNHVARCHKEKEKYYWQFRTIGFKAVPAIAFSTLTAYKQRSNAHPQWNMLLHRVVLRLNHLLGEGNLLRRWWRDEETQRLAYLDVNKRATGIRQRGQGQSAGHAQTTGAESTSKRNGNGASDVPSAGSPLGNTIGGAAGNGGQDRDASGDSDSSERRSQDDSSDSSTYADGNSSEGSNEDDNPANPDDLPMATQADTDSLPRNSFVSDSPRPPSLRAANDEAVAVEVQQWADEFSSIVPDTCPSQSRGTSTSPQNPSDQENIVPHIDIDALAARVPPSAFSYVNRPLGETRASERAMSMPIARAMRRPGITTSGPHAEDVQDIASQPLHLVPNLDDVFAPSRSLGILRRSIGMLQRLFRPPPIIVPERLPSLPPRRSPRRPTPSPLIQNRHGTFGVQRARDRVNRSPGYRAGSPMRPQGPRRANPSFTPQRSWLHNLPDRMPWDSPNESPNPPPNTLQDMPSIGVGERRPWSNTPPENTTGEPPSRSSAVFVDRNKIRRPVTPTPENGRGRTRNTNQGVTARTVHQSPEQGAFTPPRIEHPGDGPMIEVGPGGDPENAIPPWAWIPEDNLHYQAFLAHDRDLVRRGDTARLAAHRAIDALEENGVGHAIMMDVYQLLRVRYEWGLTRDYRFPQHVPGYYHPPLPVGTPRIYRWFRGGAGTAPGYLNPGLPLQRERSGNQSVERASASGSSPWFHDLLPDPNLLTRAVQPQSHGLSNSGRNVAGNDDFDVYRSTGTDGSQLGDGSYQLGQDQQDSEKSLSGCQGLLPRRNVRDQRSSEDSVSTFNLPSPIHLEQSAAGQRLLGGSGRSSHLGRNSRFYQNSPSRAASTYPATARGRRTSGASSLGLRGPPLSWPQSSGSGSQSTPLPTNARNPNVGRQTIDMPATATREQYMQMTMRQLRDEIIHRGGQPRHLRQRKKDFVQALLDYDAEGNRGNGARPRERVAVITPHPTLSPRVLRPRDNGKVVRKR